MPRDDDAVPIRAEVIEARRSRRSGAIVLARPVPMRIAAGCGAAVVAALALLLGFGEYTSKVRVAGQLVPSGGAIKVVSPQFGRITARHVNEGETVKAGQLLFELSAERIGRGGSIDERVSAQLAERRNQIIQRRDASVGQLSLRAIALSSQQRIAEGELTTHQGAIAIQAELAKSAAATYKRYAKLAKNGFVAPALLTQYQSALNVERAKSAALTLNLKNAQRTLLQIRSEAATLDGQERLAKAEARQGLAALEQETAEQDGRRATTVTAPAGGVATALAYSPGQSVQAGTVLATVLPAGSVLEAQLLVPSRALASIERGQQVQLRLDAFPYQKYGLVAGTVKQVEDSPVTDGAPGAVPAYRVTVALSANSLVINGKRKPFKSGMTLDADIFNDRRRLIEWVFDPLISAAKGRGQ
jgi:membrane fusion protein